MKFSILTYNNKVGIVTDAILLKELIHHNLTSDVDIKFVYEDCIEKSDVGIWIQNYDLNLLNKFNKNIFFINEEWAGVYELSNLNAFDYVICKSSYAMDLLKPYRNVLYIPFISKNYYNESVTKNNSVLHFAGRSIQKNTELILKLKIPITLVDPFNRYIVNENIINHIKTYQTNKEIDHLLNSHNIHVCCSLYESWGHYLYEGLSTGSEIICSEIPTFKEQLDPDLVHFIPSIEKKDLKYQYDVNINDTVPLRKSFHVDENVFYETMKNFVPKGSPEKRRALFSDIINRNSNALLKFLKNI